MASEWPSGPPVISKWQGGRGGRVAEHGAFAVCIYGSTGRSYPQQLRICVAAVDGNDRYKCKRQKFPCSATWPACLVEISGGPEDLRDCVAVSAQMVEPCSKRRRSLGFSFDPIELKDLNESPKWPTKHALCTNTSVRYVFLGHLCDSFRKPAWHYPELC